MAVVSERGWAARQYAGEEGIRLLRRQGGDEGRRQGGGRLHGATGWSGSGDAGRVTFEEGWHLNATLRYLPFY
jgi:hypothetical protein